jgi:hypothetical protein
MTPPIDPARPARLAKGSRLGSSGYRGGAGASTRGEGDPERGPKTSASKRMEARPRPGLLLSITLCREVDLPNSIFHLDGPGQS